MSVLKASLSTPVSTVLSRERACGNWFRQAGGFSSNAYLYGSEFTRESTRVVQQARIDEYVQNLELQVTRGNLALAASPVSSAQDLASGNATLASGQQLIIAIKTGTRYGPGCAGIQSSPVLVRTSFPTSRWKMATALLCLQFRPR